MRTINKLGLMAALLAGVAIGPASVLASPNDRDRDRQERPDRPDRADRSDRPDRSDMKRGGPPSNFRGQRPDRKFRGVPSGFRGDASPRTNRNVARGGGGGQQAQGSATFHGKSFSQFSSSDHHKWRRGNWRHTSHDGKFGWWWYVDGFWFFYATPIYPYPTYIGSTIFVDFGPNDYYWYWCDDPPGYYPYVRYCYSGWIPVPPTYY